MPIQMSLHMQPVVRLFVKHFPLLVNLGHVYVRCHLCIVSMWVKDVYYALDDGKTGCARSYQAEKKALKVNVQRC